MQSSFIRQLVANGVLLQFSFIRIQLHEGSRYFVMVNTLEREYHFTMKNIEGEWTIDQFIKVPQWIWNLKTQLAEAIIENETIHDSLGKD